MTKTRVAYMPLNTYPEGASDEAVLAAVALATPFKATLHVSAFSVNIPDVSSLLGRLVLDVKGMARAVESRSRAECGRLLNLVRSAGSGTGLELTQREVNLGAALDYAAEEARYFDLALLPWSSESMVAQDMAQSVLFGSGRPIVVIPPLIQRGATGLLAVAWDGSRVAARALGDALSILPPETEVAVLTVQEEKLLARQDVGQALAVALEERGIPARAHNLSLAGRSIDQALQDEALEIGASLLAMGGFGHSRLRDFILGGATKGVLSDVRLPVLMSH